MRRRTLLAMLVRLCGGLGAGRLLARTDDESRPAKIPPGTDGTSPETESSAASETERRAARTAVRELARRIARQRQVRAVGKAYLDRVPSERAVEHLMERLEEGVLPVDGEVDTITALDVRIQADFRSGEVVQLQGWQLSRTEARLFGLASLLAAGANG